MNRVLFLVMIFLSLNGCTPGGKYAAAREEPNIEAFQYEHTSSYFAILDSVGNQMTFYLDKDSGYCDYFKFRRGMDTVSELIPKLDIMTRMWKAAEDSINIKLRSFSVGYPLEYRDLLKRHIEAFYPTILIVQQDESQHVTYQNISQRMFEQQVYPVDSFLANFGYQVKGISIEKVGHVLPDRLEGLGFDPTLKIPVPFMVWINVEKIKI